MTPTTVDIGPVRDEAELRAALALRHAVFVGEQGVPPEAERDRHDATANHLAARLGGELVGTLRWRVVAPGTGKIERVAVRRDLRGSRVGAALVEVALADLAAAGLAEAVLNAQLGVQGFYERLGFRAEGPVFHEEDIAHVRMRRAAQAPGAY